MPTMTEDKVGITTFVVFYFLQHFLPSQSHSSNWDNPTGTYKSYSNFLSWLAGTKTLMVRLDVKIIQKIDVFNQISRRIDWLLPNTNLKTLITEMTTLILS